MDDFRVGFESQHDFRFEEFGLNMKTSTGVATEAATSAVLLKEVFKSYGTLRAVDGLTFGIQRGETFGLLGPNGAGKSTSIAMIAGLVKPDGGTLAVLGGDPQARTTRQRIGVAPQALALYEEFSATENLTFFGRMYGMSATTLKQRVPWALELAGLQDRAKERAGNFSGGMKRRLNIAIAMVHDPDLLLLDEPTVGVDPQSRNHIFETIERLRSSGKTIVYTTHYMEEAERLCDRVAIVDSGKICAIGTVDELLARHGGASRVEAEVAVVVPGVVWPGELQGRRLAFASATPLAEITRLSGSGVEFVSLNVRRPGLEQVFLHLTGKVLRD